MSKFKFSLSELLLGLLFGIMFGFGFVYGLDKEAERMEQHGPIAMTVERSKGASHE